MAADPTGGVLACVGNRVPSTGEVLSMTSADGSLGPVRVIGRVLRAVEFPGGRFEEHVAVEWLAVTALESRAYLAGVLEVLGVRLSGNVSGEPIEPGLELVYDARRQVVQLVSLEAGHPRSATEDLSEDPGILIFADEQPEVRVRRRPLDEPDWRDRLRDKRMTPARPARRVTQRERTTPLPVPQPPDPSEPIPSNTPWPAHERKRTPTPPRVRSASAPPDPRAEKLVPPMRPRDAGARPAQSTSYKWLQQSLARSEARAGTNYRMTAAALPDATEHVPVAGPKSGEPPKGRVRTISRPMPMEEIRSVPEFPRLAAEGEFRCAAVRGPMVCDSVGQRSCTFVVPGRMAIPGGTAIEVGVPADPVQSELLWLTGEVGRCDYDPARDEVRVCVLVDTREVPRPYRRLVQHWCNQARRGR